MHEIELELEVLSGGRNFKSKDRNQQQSPPTYDAGLMNRTGTTLMGGQHSHHCDSSFTLVMTFILYVITYIHYFIYPRISE